MTVRSERPFLQALIAFKPTHWVLPGFRHQEPETERSTVADALSVGPIGCVPVEVHGFEFKASRNDWLQEIRYSRKPDFIRKRCHRWWIVVDSKKTVHDGELPETWGLMILEDGRLNVVVEAKLSEPEWDVEFVSRLLMHLDDRAKEFQNGHEMYQAGLRAGAEPLRELERLARLRMTPKAIDQIGSFVRLLNNIMLFEKSKWRLLERMAYRILDKIDELKAIHLKGQDAKILMQEGTALARSAETLEKMMSGDWVPSRQVFEE